MENEVIYNGHKLLKVLHEQNMTRQDFQKRMGWKYASQLDSFVKGNPTAKQLAKAASILGVYVNAFFDPEVEEADGEKVENSILLNSLNKSEGIHKILEMLQKQIETNEKKNLSTDEMTKKYVACLEREVQELKAKIKKLEG